MNHRLMISCLLIASGVSVLNLMVSSVGLAQEITLNDAMVAYCQDQGLNTNTCQCWFAKMSAAEGFSEFSAQDIQEFAPHYQDELASCQADNP
ncbi:MAG: hypothetical protein F6J87_00880 [Spirulina sp. SIO3F2]|nr:hypothetical protein [Spirulina sp. SIO3F2]